MNYDPSARTRISYRSALVLSSIGCIGVILLIALAKMAIPDATANSRVPEQVEKSDSTDSTVISASETPSPDTPQVNQSDFEMARAKAALVAFLSRAEEVSQIHQKLVAESTTLQATIDSLLTNREGQRLASSEKHVDVYLAIAKKPRLSESQLSVTKQQLELLLAPVLKAEASGTGQQLGLSPDFTSELESIAATIQRALEEIQQDQKLLASILKASANGAPAKTNLQDMITKKEADEIEELAARIATVRQQEIEKNAVKLETATAELVAAETGVKLAQMEAETMEVQIKESAIRTETAESAKQAAAELAKLALEREFERDLPQIRPLLSGFVSHGAMQLDSRGYWVTGLKDGPVSYSHIKGVGALETSLTGLSKLYGLGNHGHNDRDKGSFPKSRQSLDVVRDQLLAAQGYLNKYGPLMVDKGLLAP